MMETVFPFALLCFTSLFTITSPLSTMPVFLTMTQSLDEKERRAVAIRATLVACCALLPVSSCSSFSVYLPMVSVS